MTGPGRRWAVLTVGVLGQTAAASLVYGIPFLVPTLRDREGLSLAEAGLVVSAPVTGLMLTLVLWGAAADRFGERVVITLVWPLPAWSQQPPPWPHRACW